MIRICFPDTWQQAAENGSWAGRTQATNRTSGTMPIQFLAASTRAIERWPQGSLMRTLGGSRKEKQKRRGEEEEGETKTEP